MSVRNVPVSDENGLTYRHSFFSPNDSPIILVLPASNIFTKFRRGHQKRSIVYSRFRLTNFKMLISQGRIPLF